jgi:hypothetical protein
VEREALVRQDALPVVALVTELEGERALLRMDFDIIVAREQEPVSRAVRPARPIPIVAAVAVGAEQSPVCSLRQETGKISCRRLTGDRMLGLRVYVEFFPQAAGGSLGDWAVAMTFQADLVLEAARLENLAGYAEAANLVNQPPRGRESLVGIVAVDAFGVAHPAHSRAFQTLRRGVSTSLDHRVVVRLAELALQIFQVAARGQTSRGDFATSILFGPVAAEAGLLLLPTEHGLPRQSVPDVT